MLSMCKKIKVENTFLFNYKNKNLKNVIIKNLLQNEANHKAPMSRSKIITNAVQVQMFLSVSTYGVFLYLSIFSLWISL